MTKKIVKQELSQDEEWGNIELPGLSDEELFSKNWNLSAASKEMWQDPNHKIKRQKTLTETNKLEEVKQRRSQGAKKFHSDPEKRKAWERGTTKAI